MTKANLRFSTIAWRAIQDRAPPLTHRRPVRVNLYCRAIHNYLEGKCLRYSEKLSEISLQALARQSSSWHESSLESNHESTLVAPQTCSLSLLVGLGVV